MLALKATRVRRSLPVVCCRYMVDNVKFYLTMKKLYILLFTFSLINAADAQQQIFMRIYNTSGNKFHKGYFVRTTDSSLFISVTSGLVEVPATSISYIKTKRSTVHGVLVGALAGI